MAWETKAWSEYGIAWICRSRACLTSPAVLPNRFGRQFWWEGALPRRQGEAVLLWGLWTQLPCAGEEGQGQSRSARVRESPSSPPVPALMGESMG